MNTSSMIEAIVEREYDHLAKIYDRRWRACITNTLTFLKQWAQIDPQAIFWMSLAELGSLSGCCYSSNVEQ